MNYISLARQLLSPEEQNEMDLSIELLKSRDYSSFYEKNKDIVENILFMEELEEFLDFSGENELDKECFCFAFLCAKKYGFQAGGYEDDLTEILTGFFDEKGLAYPEITKIITRETIYTDCSDYDNFKSSLEEINQMLDKHGLKLVVFEDFVYCDCEYTALVLDKSLTECIRDSWESENFSIYL